MKSITQQLMLVSSMTMSLFFFNAQAMEEHHNMSHDAQNHEAKAHQSGQLMLDVAVAQQTIPHYFALQQALANDDLKAAKKALMAMMKVAGHQGELADLIHTMLAAKDLNEMRRPHFETLSNAYIHAVKMHQGKFAKGIYRMYCPMVYGKQGASWLQADQELKNPYFGAMMLRCGSTEEQLTH